MLDSKVPLQYQDQEEPNVIQYSVGSAVHCMDWNDQALAYGHDLGVSILTRQIEPTEKSSGLPFEFQRKWPFQYSYQHLGLPSENIRFTGNYLAASHSDHTVSYINLDQGEVKTLGGSSGHRSFINDLDISYDGVVASTGDDRNLLIWEDSNNKPPHLFRLSSVGLKVRFWDDNDSDKILVLEAGNKIRVLDWRKGQWLLTIYPSTLDSTSPFGGNVKDIGIFNSEIVAIGNGWWKKFYIPSLTGGCGYTPPTDQGRLISVKNNDNNDGNDDDGLYSLSGRYIGYAADSEASIYDLVTAGEHGSHVSLHLDQVSAITLRERGDILAVASGDKITLIKNRSINYD